jgi:glycolate oxidase iron-sulfur subunit
MQTHLDPAFDGTPDGDAAEQVLRKCVHCGFCTATCPTYQLLGDELDGPRGRIYLIKQVLEGQAPTRTTQQHLDRCLTCRSCETTCPSGVDYGRLVDIGRRIVDERVPRPAGERLQRWLLREGLTSPAFGPAMAIGQALRPLVPKALRDKVPPRLTGEAAERAHRWPTRSHPRKVLMLMGCVQPAMAPNINSATARVLDAIGVQTLVSDEAGCCGAIREHLGEHEGALADMRRNIDAWWPQVSGLGGQPKVEAIVFNASGCGASLKDYGWALRDDPAYAEKAATVSLLARDLSEWLPTLVEHLAPRLQGRTLPRLAWHPPCTLQHALKLRGGVEAGLAGLGFEVRGPSQDAHLCCGSAGTYSVLQPVLSTKLRERKLATLEGPDADIIVSANIGCIQHLQAASALPVRHWVEVLDEAL